MQAAADLADGGLDQVETLGVAEPVRERRRDFFRTAPLQHAAGKQGPEPGVGAERAIEARTR